MSKQLNKLFPFLGFEDEVLITSGGYMSMFFDAKLFDKDAVGKDGKSLIADFFKNVFESLQADVLIQQYFIKFKSVKASYPDSDCPLSESLIKDHIDHINKDVFYESKLIWVLSFKTDFIDKSSALSLLGSLFKFLVRRINFKTLQNEIDLNNQITLSESTLIGRLHAFNEVMARFKLQIINQSDFFSLNVLTQSECVSFLSFLATYDAGYLNSVIEVDESLTLSLPTPEIDVVTTSGITALRFNSAIPKYASFGSVIRFVGQTKPDFWTHKRSDVMAIDGQFIAYACFKPFSDFQKIAAFHGAKVKTEQITHNPIKRILRQGSIDTEKDNPVVFERLQKLNEARNWDIQFGEGVFSVTPFSDDVSEILPVRSKLESCIISGSGRLVWETSGIMACYYSLIPTNIYFSARKLKINSHQFAALSLVYSQNNGLDEVKMLNDIKPLCYFHTTSKERFSFSPYVGQQSLMIGVGETRGGKTFWKNFVASMMLRWNGKSSFIDIDSGSYPVADHFESISQKYELPNYSYNPFDDYLAGVNDNIFHEHIINLFELISSEVLSNDEKEVIEHSLSNLLGMPEKMHSFDYLLNMLPISIREKMSRFTSGINKNFFSTKASSKMKRINCFNLEKVYELKSLADLSYYTLLFQIINDFKFRTEKHLPKFLFVDEAHSPLMVPAFSRMVNNLARTGNKNLIGMGLFTQDASELLKLEFWPALRTACATFVFVSNPKLDDDIYKSTFGLTDYELEQIKSLIPRKEFYLIQREANISKRLEFNPSDYYLKNFTSNPVEIHNLNRAVL